MIFRFSQNNSGGYYLGPEFVLVIADTEDEAYGIASKRDVDVDAPWCRCCGRRWSSYAYEVDPDDAALTPEAVEALAAEGYYAGPRH